MTAHAHKHINKIPVYVRNKTHSFLIILDSTAAGTSLLKRNQSLGNNTRQGFLYRMSVGEGEKGGKEGGFRDEGW